MTPGHEQLGGAGLFVLQCAWAALLLDLHQTPAQVPSKWVTTPEAFEDAMSLNHDLHVSALAQVKTPDGHIWIMDTARIHQRPTTVRPRNISAAFHELMRIVPPVQCADLAPQLSSADGMSGPTEFCRLTGAAVCPNSGGGDC